MAINQISNQRTPPTLLGTHNHITRAKEMFGTMVKSKDETETKS